MPLAPRIRHAVEATVHRRYVQDVEIWAAESAVGRTPSREQVFLQHRAVSGEDGHARAGTAQLPAAGGDDRAVRGPAHAVDTARRSEVMQDGIGAERAVIQHWVGSQLTDRICSVVALRHVERALVPGEE